MNMNMEMPQIAPEDSEKMKIAQEHHLSNEGLGKLHKDPITGEWLVGLLTLAEWDDLYKGNDNTESYQAH
jgi:hypothetical protein